MAIKFDEFQFKQIKPLTELSFSQCHSKYLDFIKNSKNFPKEEKNKLTTFPDFKRKLVDSDVLIAYEDSNSETIYFPPSLSLLYQFYEKTKHFNPNDEADKIKLIIDAFYSVGKYTLKIIPYFLPILILFPDFHIAH